MRVQPNAGIGKFRHGTAPEHQRARGLQPGDGGAVGLCGGPLGQKARPRAGDLSGLVIKIFDRHQRP